MSDDTTTTVHDDDDPAAAALAVLMDAARQLEAAARRLRAIERASGNDETGPWNYRTPAQKRRLLSEARANLHAAAARLEHFDIADVLDPDAAEDGSDVDGSAR
jgi:hypothetical protein